MVACPLVRVLAAFSHIFNGKDMLFIPHKGEGLASFQHSAVAGKKKSEKSNSNQCSVLSQKYKELLPAPPKVDVSILLLLRCVLSSWGTFRANHGYTTHNNKTVSVQTG